MQARKTGSMTEQRWSVFTENGLTYEEYSTQENVCNHYVVERAACLVQSVNIVVSLSIASCGGGRASRAMVLLTELS